MIEYENTNKTFWITSHGEALIIVSVNKAKKLPLKAIGGSLEDYLRNKSIDDVIFSCCRVF